MGTLPKGEKIQQFGHIVSPDYALALVKSAYASLQNLLLESPLSSLKLARMAALSFCTTALSSAIVLAARTLRINCFTWNTVSSTNKTLPEVHTRTHYALIEQFS